MGRKSKYRRESPISLEELREKFWQVNLVVKLIDDIDLANIRGSLGMTQEELAHAIGVSIRTVTRIEYRISTASFETLVKLKKLINKRSNTSGQE